MRPKSFPILVGSFLENYFTKRGWEDKLHEYRLWTHWGEVVGPKLFQRCRPLRLKDHVLTIAVSTSTWLNELQYMKLQLLEKIKQHLGIHLKDLQLRIAPLPSLEAKVQRNLSPQVFPGKTDKHNRTSPILDIAMNEISDPELKEMLEKIVKHHCNRSPVDS